MKGIGGETSSRCVSFEWSPPWHFKACVLTVSGILSGTYSDILSGICSGILSLAFYFPVRPSTTSCYKACTKCFPVKLAQNASQSQYYFVLQSLRKVLPNTTLAQRIQSLKDQSRAALTMGNTRVPAAPVAQTRLPTSTPGVTL